jgi:hypothetical protein
MGSISGSVLLRSAAALGALASGAVALAVPAFASTGPGSLPASPPSPSSPPSPGSPSSPGSIATDRVAGLLTLADAINATTATFSVPAVQCGSGPAGSVWFTSITTKANFSLLGAVTATCSGGTASYQANVYDGTNWGGSPVAVAMGDSITIRANVSDGAATMQVTDTTTDHQVSEQVDPPADPSTQPFIKSLTGVTVLDPAAPFSAVTMTGIELNGTPELSHPYFRANAVAQDGSKIATVGDLHSTSLVLSYVGPAAA